LLELGRQVTRLRQGSMPERAMRAEERRARFYSTSLRNWGNTLETLFSR
jgi:hypothetical protein